MELERRFTGAAFGTGLGQLPDGALGMGADGKILDTDDEDDYSSGFEVSIQPTNLRYVTSHRGIPSSADMDTVTDSGSYTPTSDGSMHGMRRRGSPRYID